MLKAYMEQNIADGYIQQLPLLVAEPNLLEKQNDETKTLCDNYHGFHHKPVNEQYPHPTITSILDSVCLAWVVTKLNLGIAYNVIHIDNVHHYKMTFQMCYSHFEYWMMGFSLLNFLATC